MFYLKDNIKATCYGCGACAQICTKKAIKMEIDSKLFLYPVIDKNICVNCGLCEKVCPGLMTLTEPKSKYAVAAISKYDDVVKSSSGGAFMSIVKSFEQDKDVYFVGAAFDSLKVKHKIVDSVSQAEIFRKSKYVQSEIGDCYISIKNLLDNKKTVIFSGTPCQCAGLKCFLNKDYENLILIDLVCHGVPSQGLFDKFINDNKIKNIKSFQFKNKEPYLNKIDPRSAVITSENSRKIVTRNNCSYLRAFYGQLIFRDSCGNCKFANGNRISDITLGDFWNIKDLYPELDPERGVSVILINTEKGNRIIEKAKNNLIIFDTNYEFALKSNAQLNHPTSFHPKRELFFDLLTYKSFDDAVFTCIPKEKIFKKILRKVFNFFK